MLATATAVFVGCPTQEQIAQETETADNLAEFNDAVKKIEKQLAPGETLASIMETYESVKKIHDDAILEIEENSGVVIATLIKRVSDEIIAKVAFEKTNEVRANLNATPTGAPGDETVASLGDKEHYALVAAAVNAVNAQANSVVATVVNDNREPILKTVDSAKQDDVAERVETGIRAYSQGLYTGETIGGLIDNTFGNNTPEANATSSALTAAVTTVRGATDRKTDVAVASPAAVTVATGSMTSANGPVAIDKRKVAGSRFTAWMNVQKFKLSSSGVNDYTSLYYLDTTQDGGWDITGEAGTVGIINATVANSSVPGVVWQTQQAIRSLLIEWAMDPSIV